MWRTERSGERGTSAPAVSSEDSSLLGLGLLSAVSRPAVSFLQRYLPPRVKPDFLEPERDFLQIHSLRHVELHSLPWINLSELGIQEDTRPPEDMITQTGFSSSGTSSKLSRPSRSWWSGVWSSAEDERLLCAETRIISFIQERTERDQGLSLSSGLSPGLSSGLSRLRLVQSLGLSGDQDHGYFSLEEEQLVAKAQLQSALPGMRSAQKPEEQDETLEEPKEEQEETTEDLLSLKCENKAIAFIMGCPCSDDSASEDSEEEEEEEDSEEDSEEEDDGFDSVCSSEASCSEEEQEEEEEEFDSDSERLWSSLCQSDDPYNPRNFTAKLSSAPRPIPRPEPAPEEEQASPGSCASSVSALVSSSVSSSVSSVSSSSWDEASDTEEQNLKLLGSFCSSDPYSPLNFQAPIRTKTRPETQPGPDPSPETKPGPGPDPRPEEPRVRKISECSQSSAKSTRKKTKKVRFCLEVQTFWAGPEERRGQWEEFARDRARFVKRCKDLEPIISLCLMPEHRRRVYSSLSHSESSCLQLEEGQSQHRNTACGLTDKGNSQLEKTWAVTGQPEAEEG